MRLASCPAGYILVRDHDQPESDECVQCPAGKYSTKKATYSEFGDVLHTLVVTRASLALSLCQECNWLRSKCSGGDDVTPIRGFWRAPLANVSGRRQLGPSSSLDTSNSSEDLAATKVELFPCGEYTPIFSRALAQL
jgi:hypothetical protein